MFKHISALLAPHRFTKEEWLGIGSCDVLSCTGKATEYDKMTDRALCADHFWHTEEPDFTEDELEEIHDSKT